MQPVQLKMARAALGWSVEELARTAQVEGSAIVDLEAGKDVRGDAVSALNLCLSTHGIELIEGDGVRAKTTSTAASVPVEQLTTGNDGGIS